MYRPDRLTLGLLVLSATNAWAATYYVSPDGDNANTGLAPTDAQALRTIQAGVAKLQPGDTLAVRGSVYREAVMFPRSGATGKPITLRALKGEKVVVTGCEPVVGWERHSGRVWKAPMPWTLGLGRNQVFVDGKIAIEARHPNTPEPGLGMYVSDLSPLWPTFAELSIPDPVKAPGRIVGEVLEGCPDDHWKGACYYGVHYQGWSAQTGIIESSKPGEITVGDRTRTWWFGQAYGGRYKPEEGRGMIVGHMNALDQPGEWHWQDDTLYLIPADGREPRRVEAKRRQLAFDLSAREHIRIEGIDVKSASLWLEDSADCVVDGCDLSYVSHFRRFYSIGQIEHGRDTIKSGETGIFVGGRENSFLNCRVRYSAGAGFYLRGYHHTIHNCLIDEIDYTSHYLNAITDAVADFKDYENFLVGGHVITHNTMRNAGRHFFNFYGNGTSRASRDRGPMDYMATLFAHNHLYNGMLQTKDAGLLTGYYSSGGTLNGLNSQVVYNVLHDTYDIFAMRIHKLGLVYLDAGTCDVDLHHNLLWAAPGSLQRGLWYNTMCVDINEYDNRFHEMFERTCAQLRPEDFPEGRPFRFGHDFDSPAPVPQWPQLERLRLEAEHCAAHSDRVAPSSAGVTGLRDGDWVRFDGVDFGSVWQSVVMRLASDLKAVNTDGSARARPRHRKATDPLVLEAIINDGVADGIRRQWTFLYNTAPGSWLRFDQVPLGEGYRRFRVVYGNDQPRARTVEVRLDRVDGPLVGEVALPQTDRSRGGRIQIYGHAVGQIAAEATGKRDVYLVFQSDDGKHVGEFEYFRFEHYRGSIALQKSEVKIELRVGGRTGEKIGELYPRFTGGPSRFRDFVAPIEPISGTEPLFLRIRSALPGSVGTIDWLSFEKARKPMDLSDIGLPPRRNERGDMVLPKPTHRPCAKPADKYPKRKPTIRTSPRPIFVATGLQTPPTIDGELDEWAANKRSMTLSESWDGSPSRGAASTAWIGYDDEAMFIAVKHSVKDAKALNFASHEWGVTDAMEVAFQDGRAAKPGPTLDLYGWPDGHVVSTGQAGAPTDAVEKLGKAVTYQAAIGPDNWSCEWRIPFAACGFTPKNAPLVLLNLGVRKMADNAWVIWRGTGTATYVVEDAGMLVFANEFMALRNPPTEKLEVWLDAAEVETLEVDEAGKVSQWKDRSGKGRHARQESAQFRPLLDPAGLNGRPALQFDEKARTRLELPDLSDQKISATIFAVFSNPKPGSFVNHDPRLLTASNGKGYDYQIGLCASIRGMETGGPRQAVTVHRDRWAKRVRVGCFSPMYQTFLTGHISEILVYSRVVAQEERDCVRAYLATKWNLP